MGVQSSHTVRRTNFRTPEAQAIWDTRLEMTCGACAVMCRSRDRDNITAHGHRHNRGEQRQLLQSAGPPKRAGLQTGDKCTWDPVHSRSRAVRVNKPHEKDQPSKTKTGINNKKFNRNKIKNKKQGQTNHDKAHRNNQKTLAIPRAKKGEGRGRKKKEKKKGGGKRGRGG